MLACIDYYSLPQKMEEVYGSIFLLNVGEFYQTTYHHIADGMFMVTAVRISYLRKATVSVFRCLLCIRQGTGIAYLV
jgi:hypothetical protein